MLFQEIFKKLNKCQIDSDCCECKECGDYNLCVDIFHDSQKIIDEKDKRLEWHIKECFKKDEEIKRFTKAFSDFLGITDGKPISAYDVNLILIRLKEMQKTKLEGLEKTAPDTYLRMKLRLDEKDARIKELEGMVEIMKCCDNCANSNPKKGHYCRIDKSKENPCSRNESGPYMNGSDKWTIGN